MVLFYGLLAFETANNTVAATAATKTTSQRVNISRKENSIEKVSSSTTNSWIYTEDLRKHFEERYVDYRFVFVPVYVNGKKCHHNYSTTEILREKGDKENSWMYSKSIRDRLFYSTSKISLPLTTNLSSSIYYITNQELIMHNKSQIDKNSKKIFSKQSSSSSSSSCTISFVRYFVKLLFVLNNDNDEDTQNENHSIPLIKHLSIDSSCTTNELSNDKKNFVNTTINNQLTNNKSNRKQTNTHNNRLARLRSFFSKSSSLPSTQHQQTTNLSSSTLHNRIPKT
ncbi:unnamed protein product [Rotaria sp. Silwood2]|nr:unnamed protein product [Rotaria sp. Silwood2]CAF4536032.1 unnamed protein product [Rotaria sp. Silwood2]